MGCASREVNWDQRRGTYSYEEAVKQYGPPSRVESMPDGSKTGYWAVADAHTYAFKFQLPNFDGNNEGSLNPGKGEVPHGGRPLGTMGKPVLKLTFGPDDRLTDAVRIKDSPPEPVVAPATPKATTP